MSLMRLSVKKAAQTFLELRTGNPGESRMNFDNANQLHRKSGKRQIQWAA
jgi:hypothetical protein